MEKKTLPVGDEDVGDEPEGNDVALEIRPLDRTQTIEDRFLGLSS
jgi:hypothetical protein